MKMIQMFTELSHLKVKELFLVDILNNTIQELKIGSAI